MEMITAFLATIGATATTAGASATAATAAGSTAAASAAATSAAAMTAASTAAVTASAAGAGAAAAGSAAAASSAATAAAAAAKGLSLAKILGAASFAGSTVAALSNYAMMRQQAQAMGAEGFDEELAARTEYLQATERQAAITREFVRVVGDQQLAAVAGGVDIGSASVAEARRAAQEEADRQVSVDRNSAVMNASLRRARASVLRRGAAVTRRVAPYAAAGQIASAGFNTARIVA